LLEKSCYNPRAQTKPNIQTSLFSFPWLKKGLRRIKQLHFGAAVIHLLFHHVVYVLCLVNAGTDCCTNLRYTTDITKLPPPQSSSYRIPPSLSSTLYKHRNLPLHKSKEHKRKWPQNFGLSSPPPRQRALIAEWNVSPRWTSNQPLRFRFINISANHSAVEAWLRLWLVLLSPQLKPVHLWEGKQ